MAVIAYQNVKPRRGLRMVAWLLLVLAFLGMLVLVDELISRGRVGRAMRQTKRLGGALTVNELEAARTARPLTQDAWPVFKKILDDHQSEFDEKYPKELPVLGYADAPELGHLWRLRNFVSPKISCSSINRCCLAWPG